MKAMLRALFLVASFSVAGTILAAEIALFEHDDFRGRTLVSDRPIPDLASSGFNDAASSVIVKSGRWQLCSDAHFRGECITLERGEYPSLRRTGMNDRVSSLREVGPGGPARVEAPVVVAPPPRSQSRATLYSGHDFAGRPFVIEHEVIADLATSGFNDRASSLRIEGGYWLFCSDAHFLGSCRTFGPGDYRSLPPDLDNRISSGRRISTGYPYSGAPDWSRGR